MRVKDIMTERPAYCSADDTIEQAARLMEQNDCGCIPVTEGRDGNLVGVITDRDITVRATGRGRPLSTRVRDVMAASPHCCRADDDVREVERIMSELQVRRVPVIDDAGSCCVGMVAQADLARAAEHRREVTDAEVGRVVERISEPAR
jgi:CBS domain-containing protein